MRWTGMCWIGMRDAMHLISAVFHRQYPPRQALLLVFLSSAIWGLLWVPMRYLESVGLSGLWAVVLFHLLPAAAMLPFMRSLVLIGRDQWGSVLAAGLLMGAGFVLYSLGLVMASVTKTVVLFYMTPIWSSLLAFVWLDERAGFGRVVAIAGALVGCVLITAVHEDLAGFDRLDMLGLLSGLLWAIGSVIIRRYDRLDYRHITFFQYLLGGLIALLAALAFAGPVPALPIWLVAIPPAFVASSVVFLPTALLIFRIMQYISPGLVGILMLSEALVAAVSAAWMLGEILTASQWAGVGLILATGAFVGVAEGRKV